MASSFVADEALRLQLMDLAAEESGETEELFGGNVFEVAGGEFLFDRVLMSGEVCKFLLPMGQELLLSHLRVDQAEVLDFGVEHAVPVDEGAFGDVEGFGEAGESPALGTEFNEFVFGWLVNHGGRCSNLD